MAMRRRQRMLSTRMVRQLGTAGKEADADSTDQSVASSQMVWSVRHSTMRISAVEKLMR
jgi:hypothetical protein